MDKVVIYTDGACSGNPGNGYPFWTLEDSNTKAN